MVRVPEGRGLGSRLTETGAGTVYSGEVIAALLRALTAGSRIYDIFGSRANIEEKHWERCMDRRTLLKTAAGAAAFGVMQAPAVHAQGAWPVPGRTVKVIVPWPPGAANDALGRLLAQKLQEKFGASTVVENRTGGAGLIGTNAVIQAEPDGYTLLASAFNTAVMPMVIKGATFDPEVDLEVMARTAVAPLVCVMTGSRPQKDLAEMLAAAKAKPKEWLFAISSLGSAGHLATIDFTRRTGIKFDLVPYRGTHAGADRHHGRQCPVAVRPGLRAAARREGPHAGSRARHRVEDALAARARACHHRRAGAARLRVQFVVRRVGAEGHAARHLPRRSTG